MPPARREFLAPRARFDDAARGRSLIVDAVDEEIVVDRPAELRPALRRVQAAVDGGAWAVVMLSYEAAAAFDPAARVQPGRAPEPLAWFGLCDPPREVPYLAELPQGLGGYQAEPWQWAWEESEHAAAVQRVRAAIAAGETYQANLTTMLHGHLGGDLLAAYRDLAAAQHAAHACWLDLGGQAILSASPELFLQREGQRITTTPMKGTAARGEGPAADAAARADLRSSAKERAENVMITDLLRNDLARLAVPGSVDVPSLLAVEPYPTLWQMTSTVTARARPGAGLEDVLEATFPCGSITGAPKLATMGHLAALETEPRGVYCGTLGLLGPDTARLSVAIRTLVVDRATGASRYGVGSGITWASEPAAEWAELHAKTRVLDALAGGAAPTPQPDRDLAGFGLIETLRVQDGAPRHLAAHLDRLLAGAERFGIEAEREALAAQIRQCAAAAREGVLRACLLLDGALHLTVRAVPPVPERPVRLALDTVVQDPEAPAIRHKTTERGHYTAALDRARARHPEAEDVILRGRDGRVTETTIATLVARVDGTWVTPPVTDGLLPGIARRLALEAGEITERPLTADDLRAAEEIALLSTVRGWRPAVLLER